MDKKYIGSVFEEETSKSIHQMKILIQVLKRKNKTVTMVYRRQENECRVDLVERKQYITSNFQ